MNRFSKPKQHKNGTDNMQKRLKRLCIRCECKKKCHPITTDNDDFKLRTHCDGEKNTHQDEHE